MSWPLASHFSAMLQNPRLAFRDPELKRCRIERDRRNQPRPWSGAFAVVYKGMPANGDRPFAIRVFTTESPERRERYGLASAYLKTRRLTCLVDFEYRDDSIRSAGDGKWYPLILMDWVEGETLFSWVRARSLEGNGHALARAAARWVDLVKELADAQIAHGDLQHANVMVTRTGELKLVDYDCMCVPALVGRRNLEVGVEPYQHPDRNDTTHLSLDLDNFSALVIYVALRALAVDPSLWAKHVERTAYDKLLFRGEDFRAPEASPLYHDLRNAPTQDVRDLAEKLFSLSRTVLDRVPALHVLTNSYAKIEELLASRQWQRAVDLLNRRGRFRDAPKRLKPLIHQAYEHVCRKQAWDAFRKLLPLPTSELNDRKLVNAWNEVLFAGFEPAERERPRIAAARRNVVTIDRLHHLVQRSSNETTLPQEKSVAAAAKHFPDGYDYSLKPRVRRARQRVDAIRRLDQALRESADEAAIVAAWRDVVDAQCERFVNADDRPRIQLAEKRLGMIEALQAIPDGLPPDQFDRRLLDAWSEDVAGGCREVEPWRSAYEWAVYRKQLLDRIQQAISGRDDSALVKLLEDPCLEGFTFPASWTPAIRIARERVAKTEALLTALRNGDRSSFVEQFDARVIRQHSDRFAEYDSLLSKWTGAHILPLEGLGLGPALARASLFCIDKRQRTYRVRWTWPQQRFTDECMLAVCADEPGPDDDPRDLETRFRLPVDRQNWESGGGSRVLHAEPEWTGSLVVVWAMVDLGFRVFTSEPLVLGRLDPDANPSGRKQKRNSLAARRTEEPLARRDRSGGVEPSENNNDPRQA